MNRIVPLTAIVAAAALLSVAALAQTPPKDSKNMPTQTQISPTTPSTQTQMPSTQNSVNTTMQGSNWRGSQLIGLDVYSNNENIGEIEDVILTKDGKIDLIVVGVGGWLGMGEHDVALRWDQVSFSDQPRKGDTTNAEAGEKPDHAMVSMTKEQLKAMPAFKYSSQNKT